MNKTPTADIHPNMESNAAAAKEHQIAGLKLAIAYVTTVGELAGSATVNRVTELTVDIIHQTGAIKAVARILRTVDIPITDEALGKFTNEPAELRLVHMARKLCQRGDGGDDARICDVILQ